MPPESRKIKKDDPVMCDATEPVGLKVRLSRIQDGLIKKSAHLFSEQASMEREAGLEDREQELHDAQRDDGIPPRNATAAANRDRSS